MVRINVQSTSERECLAGWTRDYFVEVEVLTKIPGKIVLQQSMKFLNRLIVRVELEGMDSTILSTEAGRTRYFDKEEDAYNAGKDYLHALLRNVYFSSRIS